MRNQKTGEKITLVGHSHGGNVAIQAAELLYRRYNVSVEIINFNTPAYDDIGDPENPNDNLGIRKLTHFYTKQDGVAGGFAGSDRYHAAQAHVTQIKLTDPQDKGWLGAHFMPNVNREEAKQKKEDADLQAATRSGGL